MIEKLFLKNFQGYGEQTKVSLAPLTLIFGPNSSGKSSIIRALLLLQQSVLHSYSDNKGEFSFAGGSIDLGSFTNTVNGHKNNKRIEVGIEFDNFIAHATKQGSGYWFDKIEWVIGNDSSPKEVRLSGTQLDPNWENDYFTLIFKPAAIDSTEEDLGQTPSVQQRAPRWELSPQSERILKKLASIGLAESGQVSRKSRETESLSIEDIAKRLEIRIPEGLDLEKLVEESRHSKSRWRLSSLFPRQLTSGLPSELRRVAKTPRESANLYALWSVFNSNQHGMLNTVSEFGQELREQLDPRRLVHVPPIRPIPGRLTILASSRASEHKSFRDLTTLLAVDPESRKRVSAWIRHLTDDAYELDFLPVSSNASPLVGEVGTLVLRDTKTKTAVTFNDVGVGLSQVLPVVEGLLSAEQIRELRAKPGLGSTVLIEQPELHLHPVMQGELMGLFVEHVSSKETRQIIAETHSETMVLRLQSEIRKGRISADAVSILYVDRDQITGNSKVTKLEMTDRGEFVHSWPKSFSSIRLDQMKLADENPDN